MVSAVGPVVVAAVNDEVPFHVLRRAAAQPGRQAATVSANAGAGSFSVVQHEYGSLLRIQAAGIEAADMAVELLGMLEAELHADVEDTGWKQGHRLEAATPVLIRLEGLQVELTTDGNEIVFSHAGGSQHEFEELCDFIRQQANLP